MIMCDRASEPWTRPSVATLAALCKTEVSNSVAIMGGDQLDVRVASYTISMLLLALFGPNLVELCVTIHGF